MKQYDVIIIGAGAAGLTAAAALTSNGRRVVVLDMGDAPARKVRVSGGGRCNITNLDATAHRYFGENPNFVRSALARVTPRDILSWAIQHGIKTTQKSPGQYFCDDAQNVVSALMHDARGADFYWGKSVSEVTHNGQEFIVQGFVAPKLIIATGGVSYPALGVSDAGHKIAKQFGHKIVPMRPALCAINTDAFDAALAGISVDAEIKIGKESVRDALLFTHNGIGGPAVYRATVRNLDANWHINLAPNVDIYAALKAAKQIHGRQQMRTVLGQYLPARLAAWFAGEHDKNIADWRDADLAAVAARINNVIIERGNIKLNGMAGAEVCRGGIDTRDVSSKTMESKLRPGLFFAGEVLDVAGDLGGFNLQWAWASGRIAGAAAQE